VSHRLRGIFTHPGHEASTTGLPFSIRHTAGADRKLPPASFAILPAVPLYSLVDGSLQGHEANTKTGQAGRINPRHIITAQKLCSRARPAHSRIAPLRNAHGRMGSLPETTPASTRS
jgi:hypothetical protein